MLDFIRPRFMFALVLLGSIAGGISLAHAQDVTYFKAALNGASTVPPVNTAATGEATFDYNPATKELSWTINYTGLSGPATAAHIHGPAEAGKNAGVLIPFQSAEAPITGSATLTDAQLADLEAGRLYVNIHTAANPGGEIRGQIVK